MFEKKKKFGCLIGSLKSMATVGSDSYYNSGIAELAQHVLDCHAEIDRLNDELTAAKQHEEVFLIAIRKMTNEVDAHKWKRLRGLDDAARRFQRYCNLIRTLRASNAEQLREVHALRKSYQRSIIAMDAGSATIDRLNAELTALRAQPVERVWISSETHERFTETGIYFVRKQSGGWYTTIDSEGTLIPANGNQYTLILAEKDFPYPSKPQPKPIEVKVGKYQLDIGEVGEIFDIDEHGTCAYRLKASKAPLVLLSMDAMKDILARGNAVFIGEGDNQ